MSKAADAFDAAAKRVPGTGYVRTLRRGGPLFDGHQPCSRGLDGSLLNRRYSADVEHSPINFADEAKTKGDERCVRIRLVFSNPHWTYAGQFENEIAQTEYVGSPNRCF